ncbi:hypothetical protein GCM10027446_19090 [Angustibacter peucedani]
MDVRLEPWQPDDTDALVDFLTGDTWPFHAAPVVDGALVRERAAGGYYLGPATQTLWVIAADDEVADDRAGLVRLFDLEDPTPVFDLRVREPWRGRGVGTQALRALTAHAFGERPAALRVEGTTRADNGAMRTVFERCGYVQEAHYRDGWPDADGGAVHDAVGYAVLRRDHESGRTTPVRWPGGPGGTPHGRARP